MLRVMAREGLTEKERMWKRNLKKHFFFFIWINIFLRLTLQHCTSFACLFSRISFIYKSLWLSFQIFLFQTVPRYINEIMQDLLSDREFCVDKKFSSRRVEFRIFGGEISFCFLCTYRHPQYECILSKEHAKKLRNMRKVFHFYDVISQVWTILYLMAISFMTESKTQWKYLRYVHMFFFYRFLGTTFQLHFIRLLRNRYFYQSMCFS